MRYLTLDIESSSLNPSPDHILAVAMVVEDTNNIKPLNELPRFVCAVKHDEIKGQAYALAMNGWLLDIISGRNRDSDIPIYRAKPRHDDPLYAGLTALNNLNTWYGQANKFLDEHFGTNKITVAGKNVVGFDIQFMPEEIKSRFRHRCIDVGSAFIDWDNDTIYSLDTLLCKHIDPDRKVSHNPLQDCYDVIELLRLTYDKGKK